MAVELATAYVNIALASKGLGKDIDKEIGGHEPAAEKSGKSIGARLTGTFKKAMQVGGLAVGTAFSATLAKGFGRLTAIEDAQAKLAGLGHSGQSVDQIMADALASVKGTAFGLGDAATIAASAVASGIKPGKELERTLSLVGDAATIGGSSLDEMGAIFSKVAATGKVSGDVLNQLGLRGIPIMDLLAEQLGVTADEVSSMVSRGEVDFATFQNAIEAGMGGAALESANTTRGAIANFGAAVGRLGADILSQSGAFDGLRKFFVGATGWVDDAAARVGPAAERITAAVSGVVDRLRTAGQSDTARRMFATLERIWDRMVRSGGALVQPLKDIAGTLATASAAIGFSVWELFLGVLEAASVVIESVLVPAITALSQWMRENQALVTIALGVYTGYRLLMTGIAAGKAIVTAATTAWAVAQRVLNAAMRANPIMLVVTAIGLLVSAFVWAWNSSETFREIVIGVWEAVSGAVMAAVDWIVEAVQAAWDFIVDAWQAVGDFLTGLWDGIAGAASAVWDGITGAITGAVTKAGDFIRNVWNGVLSFLGGIWNSISGGFSSLWNGVINTAKSILGGIGNAVSNAFSGIGNIIKAPINGIIQGINSVAIGGLNKLIDGANKIPFVNIPHIPKIPMLAEGGIVTRAILAVVGEGRESEAVMPLSKLDALLDRERDEAGGGEGGGVTINYHVDTVTAKSESELRDDGAELVRLAAAL